MYNVGGEDNCVQQATAASFNMLVVAMVNENGEFVGPTMIDLGEISRDEEARISATFSNTTGSVFNGFIDVQLTTWCPEGGTFNVVPMNPITLMQDEEITLTYGEQCSAASLDQHEIIVTLYDSQTAIVDQVIGTFTLTETPPAE